MSSRAAPKKRSSWYVTSNDRLFTERRTSYLKKVGDKKFSAKDFDPNNSTPTETWSFISFMVLPLFNGEGIQETIESLNELMTQQLEIRGFNVVLADFKDLLRVGMGTMQDKLQNVPDDLLALRLVELWTFFFSSVLPYLEGVFEPMASESEKSFRIDLGDSTPTSLVRDLSLAACRDFVLKPTLDRLEPVLHSSFSDLGNDKRAIDALWKMIQLFTFLNSKKDDLSKRTEGLLKDLKYYATASNQGLRRVDSVVLLG